MKSRIFERMIEEKLFLNKNLRSISDFINKIQLALTSIIQIL